MFSINQERLEIKLATYDRETIKSVIGTEVGVSDWLTVTQDMVSQFAALTRDPVEIHTNVELAKATPFGGTIAHGLLTLSLIGGFCTSAEVVMQGITMGLNYGFDKVRFIAPVKTGSRVRGRFFLRAMEEKKPGQWVSTFDVTIEIEGEEKPALIAEWLGMQFAA
jgi:acyl dehydratase